ncbi:MAG: gliding motility-associated C-terminal domain-containing protein [Crocinitomicaceae bacterium]|nr:gliding motility-associated C-terminal domain-containing protein [Crocinitomicaceae bacterium]
MPKTKHFLFVLLVFTGSLSFGQLEKHIWHFNTTNKGLFFDPGNSFIPVVTNSSYTPFGGEGCGVVTHPITGVLQFYSDGMICADRNDDVMPNGSGLSGLSSSISNGKACLVPGYCDRYYLFSNSYTHEANTTGSVYYSVVDMNLVGNGVVGNELGDILAGQKNIFVATGISEAIEIIPKTNSHEYWLLIGKNVANQIEIYNVTASGILLHSTYNLPYVLSDMRAMVYCEQNNKVALASCIEMNPTVIMDFDPATGIVTSTFQIPGTPFGTSPLYWMGTNALEWSPDGTKLYIGKYRTSSPSGGGKLFHYDLDLPANPPQILVNLGTNSSIVSRGLRLAPDGKIYYMYTNPSGIVQQLGVIHNPDGDFASCNFQSNFLNMGINLGNSNSFPFFLNWNNTLPEISDTLISFACELPASFSFTPLAGITDFENDNLSFSVDNISGGTVSVSGSDILFTPTPGFVGLTSFEVVYEDDFCFPLTDSFVVELEVDMTGGTLNLLDQIEACENETVILNAGGSFASYLWSTSESTSQISVNSPGIYSVEVATLSGCTAFDTTEVIYLTAQQLNLGPDISTCEEEVIITAGIFNGDVIWFDGSSGSSVSVSASGLIYADGVDLNGCSSSDTLQVVMFPSDPVDLGDDMLICDEPVYLVAAGYSSVVWSTGDFTDSLLVNSEGLYTVEATNSFGCTTSDEIEIDYIEVSSVSLGPDISTCSDNSINLHTGNTQGSFLWSDGNTGESILVEESGVYFVEQTVCGITIRDSIEVTINTLDKVVFIPNAFTPDGNNLNPVFVPVIAETGSIISYELHIFDRWGGVVFHSEVINEFWNGTNSKGIVQDGVYTYRIAIEYDCPEDPYWVKFGHVTVLK